jgi:hypothetical protein
MGIKTLYTSNFEKLYKAKTISCLSLFYCFTLLVAIIAPFGIVYSAGNLWTKQSSYLEQAMVSFTNKLLIAVVDSNGQTRTYSTVKEINDASESNLAGPYISLRHIDTDYDGTADSLSIVVKFKGDPKEVRNVQVIGSFDYSLDKLLEMEMVGLMYLDIDTPTGASAIIADGSLNLVQQEPVMITSKKKDIYATDPLDSYSKYTLP